MTPDDFHIQGYIYVLTNSKSLQKMADKSADESEFGIACSLNILSAEEAVKGIAIILSVNGITSDFNKLFKDHKTKHQHLFELSLLNQIQIEKMVKNFKIKETITQIDSLPDDVRKTVIEKFPKFYSNSLSLFLRKRLAHWA